MVTDIVANEMAVLEMVDAVERAMRCDVVVILEDGQQVRVTGHALQQQVSGPPALLLWTNPPNAVRISDLIHGAPL